MSSRWSRCSSGRPSRLRLSGMCRPLSRPTRCSTAEPARRDKAMPEPLSTRLFPPHAIAIIGLAGRFPGAKNLGEFWQNIRNGVESLETFSDAELDLAGVPAASRWHPLFVRKGAKLEDAELF